MAVTRAFLPAMRERGYGKVVNVSSVGGRLTLPFFGAYNSTKYAVESMSDALRVELQPFGVRVVLIEPGIIRTNFTPRSQEIANRYGGPGAPFAGVMPNFDALAQKSDRFAVSPASVARAMARAVERRRPAARYIAPFRTKILLGFYQLTPTRVNDWMFRTAYGLSAKKLLAEPAETRLLASGDV
jgi:short-subunit dehydrogenase